MHMRTKALVLRETAYKESDKILTLLTQEAGKLTASGRGCRKKGSPVAAGCQLLVWSDMVLYEHRGRWTVQEAAVDREFRGMRDDLVKLALGCYGAEVTELLAVEGVPNPELLSLLLNSLHALDKLDRPPALVKAAFELRCLCLAGYGPLLDACAVCGRARSSWGDSSWASGATSPRRRSPCSRRSEHAGEAVPSCRTCLIFPLFPVMIIAVGPLPAEAGTGRLQVPRAVSGGKCEDIRLCPGIF